MVCVNITTNQVRADKSLVTIPRKIANFMVTYVFFKKSKTVWGKVSKRRETAQKAVYTQDYEWLSEPLLSY